MTIRNLEFLFRPKSIAVIGASDRERSVGATVTRNLLSAGFAGPVYLVNPRVDHVAGYPAFRDVAALPRAPDLAVIATPPRTVPAIIGELGARGTRAAVVLTAGLGAERDAEGRTLSQAMLDAARAHLLRILGPNCVGLLVPGLGINASFAHTAAVPGNLAFVSQSGGLTTAVLDWARSRGIGLSHFISLGDAADVDFGDTLDYLASEGGTHAILLYIESVRDARKFMSAARAAARNKPVLVVKAGRAREGAQAAMSHTGALAGSDDVYDAAIRRAGMLRVNTVAQLFDAVQTLARATAVKGERLAIMTNGGGPGVMATDALIHGGGKLASLSRQTLERLDSLLPSTWSHGNPVDIIGDAPIERYVSTLRTLMEEPEADAILFMHVPTAIVPAADIARACAPVARKGRVLACWLGGDALNEARRIFADAGIPVYRTPEEAVTAFMQLANYRRNQQALMETPPSVPVDFAPEREKARNIVHAALQESREVLSEPEAKAMLAAYGIPVVRTTIATDANDAARVAEEIGFPVALKILSPQVTHKSDVGGVVLDLQNAAEVKNAAAAMERRLREAAPGATLAGFSVQEMIRRPRAPELIVGATVDPIFGPVILFGHGGVAVEVIGDRAVALPPLNIALARELVSRTRISRLLDGYRDRPPADRQALYLVLTQVSQLIVDFAEVAELDINPLLVDDKGAIALDARIRVVRTRASATERLAIRPYPQELEERVRLLDREVLLRPIRPEDETLHGEFLERVEQEDLQLRFFHAVRHFPHAELARFTQIDYDREMAFIAVCPADGQAAETLGVVRAISDPDGGRAEYAILVRSDVKGKGLGAALMRKIIRYCRERGIREVVGEVLAVNQRMLALCRELGFEMTAGDDPQVVRVRLELVRLELGSDSRGRQIPERRVG
ncbi:MAG: bifunctional acetate--CoA ligase family protein/GNAT family N-acetyltransferase [Betaproteobacteria bacterium]|nr:bifunctional acetate--CoA ligase family protein/GNAT family N-acetyltransferase [Betaproteobacteria bacterium]